jgi:hypothetical protein
MARKKKVEIQEVHVMEEVTPVDPFATEFCPTCEGAAIVSVCNKIDDVIENYKRYHIYYCRSCKNTFRVME